MYDFSGDHLLESKGNYLRNYTASHPTLISLTLYYSYDSRSRISFDIFGTCLSIPTESSPIIIVGFTVSRSTF